MLFESCRNSIEQLIKDSWTLTPVQFDNLPFDKEEEYIRPVVIDGESTQVTIGVDGMHRRPGILIIQIFVLKNTGTKRVKFLGDSLSSIFKSLQLGVIQFESPTLIRVGQAENYHQENLQVPFYVDIC